MTCYSLDSQWSVACGQKLFSRLFIYNLTVLGNCMFINTILLKNLSLKIELNSMVVDSKNSTFEKCFKSACKFETKPRALQNELYVPKGF